MAAPKHSESPTPRSPTHRKAPSPDIAPADHRVSSEDSPAYGARAGNSEGMSDTIDKSLVSLRLSAAASKFATIRAQLRVLAAAADAADDGALDIELCHLTTVMHELIAPCDEVDDLLGEMLLPASAEELRRLKLERGAS
ncbi:MAG: hypothetical protein ACRD3E_09770 [Terriglobales bacterium]